MVVSKACCSTDNLGYYSCRGALGTRVHWDMGTAGEP